MSVQLSPLRQLSVAGSGGPRLPATADEWLATKGQELDRRLKRFAHRLRRGDLEGVEFHDDRLHVTPVKATSTLEARALADGIEAMMPVFGSLNCCTR